MRFSRAFVLSSLLVCTFAAARAGVVANDIVQDWGILRNVKFTDKKPSGDVVTTVTGPDDLQFKAGHVCSNTGLVSGDGKWKFDPVAKRWSVNFTDAADLHYAHYAGNVNVRSFKLKDIRLSNGKLNIDGKVRGKFKCTDSGVKFITKVKGTFAGGVPG